jgi:hypothetical protein
MKHIAVILLLVFAICFANAPLVFSDEIDEVRELLANERGGDILYLSKINLGIPGGDNWIADRSNGLAYIYVIDNDKNINIQDRISYAEPSQIRYMDQSTYSRANLEFDIMRDIPGTRIGNKAATFGDFNGDGTDEIFNFYDSESLCTMWGYNSDKGEIESCFGCHYDIRDPKGPSPVEFINNQGIYNIKVNWWSLSEKQYFWIFFAWDEEQRKFVEIEKFVETEKDNIKPPQPVLAEQNTDEFAQDRETQKEVTSTDSGKNSRFYLYIGIAVGIIALALVAVFVVRRKKK